MPNIQENKRVIFLLPTHKWHILAFGECKKNWVIFEFQERRRKKCTYEELA